MEINKIHCGDCLKLMKDILNNSIDLTITSPPYDNLRDYNGYSFDFENIAKELYRVTKEGGVVVWVVGDATVNGSESGTSFKQALYFKEIGFYLHDTMIYEKTGFPFPMSNRYYQSFEYMFILTKSKLKTFNPIKKRNKTSGLRGGSHRHNGKDLEPLHTKNGIVNEIGIKTNVWDIACGSMNSKDKISFKHPATFPEKLAADHIYSWSNEGDLVYDCFMGSGTTAKMSHIHKRNWIGSELSKEYFNIANDRLKSYLNQTSLF